MNCFTVSHAELHAYQAHLLNLSLCVVAFVSFLKLSPLEMSGKCTIRLINSHTSGYTF